MKINILILFYVQLIISNKFQCNIRIIFTLIHIYIRIHIYSRLKYDYAT